jgi:hypothetical protein
MKDICRIIGVTFITQLSKGDYSQRDFRSWQRSKATHAVVMHDGHYSVVSKVRAGIMGWRDLEKALNPSVPYVPTPPKKAKDAQVTKDQAKRTRQL